MLKKIVVAAAFAMSLFGSMRVGGSGDHGSFAVSKPVNACPHYDPDCLGRWYPP